MQDHKEKDWVTVVFQRIMVGSFIEWYHKVFSTSDSSETTPLIFREVFEDWERTVLCNIARDEGRSIDEFFEDER